ncbi:hypothetical protein C8J56DRAFT_1160381 [Mycena floridula]|nr:hypothetical protein C8J56DRAFT_1160381 [Mycena floridula]
MTDARLLFHPRAIEALAVLNAIHPYVKLEIVHSSVAQRELLRWRSRIQQGPLAMTLRDPRADKARYFFGSDP